MKVCAVIPARYASTRFPGKVIYPVCGKPLIVWIWERVQSVKEIDCCYLATEDERVMEICRKYNINAVMTSKEHQSGTDRVFEIAQKIDSDIYINVQGDEPFISPDVIRLPLKLIQEDERFDITTAVSNIKDYSMLADVNVVKVAVENKRAVYFSRLPVPYHHPLSNLNDSIPYYRHIGIYVFRKKSLLDFVNSGRSVLENLERLEQLRALSCGMSIGAEIVEYDAPSIDVFEDVEKAEIFARNNNLI